jgi:hypothetical protein
MMTFAAMSGSSLGCFAARSAMVGALLLPLLPLLLLLLLLLLRFQPLLKKTLQMVQEYSTKLL